MPKIIINEFYRGGNLTTGDEFIELLLTEDVTAAELNSFFVGDSTGSKASKFSAYDFTNVDNIAPIFRAGTIIVVGGTTAVTQNTSYNPTGGDWDILLNAGGSFLPNANTGNNGDIAGDDVVWVDTSNTGATISADGFAADIGTASGAFTSAANVNFGAGTNNTGYALNSDLAGANNTANWTTNIPFASTTLSSANGGANTTYINSLRSTSPVGPVVSSEATDASAAEAAADPGVFRISRTGDTTAALTVNYTISGQATNGVDYTPTLSGTVTIAAGSSSADITITPADDSEVEGNETVTLTLTDTADYDLGSSSNATVTIADNDVGPGALRIRDIQGAAHVSPLNGQTVSNVPGIVTALRSNGFYIEDPNPDSDERTSEGIFIFTSSAPTVAVGTSVLVSGTVSEFRPGSDSENLSITQITSPSVIALSTGNALPAPTVISAASGSGVRTIPNRVIVNDATNGDVESSQFDPSEDGIDFYESLEGMRVQINNAVTSGLRNGFGELWVLADNGAGATGVNSRSSITISGSDATNINDAFANSDFNPELIQIDDTLSGPNPNANSGTQLSTIVGVVSYDFGEYEVLPTTAPTVVTPSTLTKEVTSLASGGADQLTIATFNVENLDPGDGTARFDAIAQAIVSNLLSPDILSLEEIQDNNGPTNDSVVDASTTFQTLIDAIARAGGPTYEFRQINPVDDTNGGEPGGNIRVGFLFNPNRVDFVDRPGGTSTTSTTVINVNGEPQTSSSPGLIDPTSPAFNSSRKPLVGEFVFNGQTVFVIGNHFTSRGGSDALFERIQPPTQGGQSQREAQAAEVNEFVDAILAVNPNAKVAVVGDFNEFQFFPALQILEGDVPGDQKVLSNLHETLPVNERYTYNFEGNAQVLDHILVSSNLLSNLNGFDVVHINSEFTDQISDHDPLLARFNIQRQFNVINGTPGNDNLNGTADADQINGGAGNDTLNGGAGNDTLNGGTGDDLYIVDSVTDTLVESLGEGTDTVQSSVSLVLSDNLENLTLTGASIINGRGNSLNNSIFGNAANNLLEGLDGDDTLDGGAGSDVLNGGAGNDSLLGGAGRKDLNGGTGNDTYVVDRLSDNIVEFSDQGADTVQASVNWVLGNNLENLVLTGASRNGTGNGLDNSIAGNASNNRLEGLDGNDTLNGGAGNDTLDGGAGSDSLNGGAGSDIYVVDTLSDTIVENSGEGNDTVQASISWVLGDNLENLTLTGTNAINGTGNSLSNRITGNTADNLLQGQDGSDFLNAGAGNDTLSGGNGVDTLTGGSGNDNFAFTGTSFSQVGNDRITDFAIADDRIRLDKALFTALTSTAGPGFSVSTEFAVVGTNTAAAGVSALIVYNANNGRLFYNQNGLTAGFGDGGGFAELSNAPIIGANNFVIV